jgi:hypothetical protein
MPPGSGPFLGSPSDCGVGRSRIAYADLDRVWGARFWRGLGTVPAHLQRTLQRENVEADMFSETRGAVKGG